MRIILKRCAIANGDASDLLSRIEAKRAEVEKLSSALDKRRKLRVYNP